MAKVWIIIVVVVLLVAGAFYMFMQDKPPMAPVTETTNTETNTIQTTYSNITERTIAIREQNDSGEAGSAMLVEKDGKITVTLDMTGAPKDVPQPAHIHAGACPDVGAVTYPLTNVVNGKSTTVLDTTFAKLDAKMPMAINVHKSVPEAKVYVACGNLSPSADPVSPSSSPASSPAASSMPSSSPSSSASPTPIPSPTPVASAI